LLLDHWRAERNWSRNCRGLRLPSLHTHSHYLCYKRDQTLRSSKMLRIFDLANTTVAIKADIYETSFGVHVVSEALKDGK